MWDKHKLINHSRPTIILSDYYAVLKQMINHNLSSASKTMEVKLLLKKYFDVPGVDVFSTGKAALITLLLNLEIKENDEVIIPTYVCKEVFEAIKFVGANPILVDIGDDYCISYQKLESKISIKTKAIIIVHTFGISANINELKNIILRKDIYIIEDLAHSFGGEFEKKKLGTFGDVAFGSFHATKLLTSGEGGFIIFNNDQLWESYAKRHFNYDIGSAMSDLASSLLLNQLFHIDEFINKRKLIAKKYLESFKDLNAYLPIIDINKSIYFRFPIRKEGIDFEMIKTSFLQKKIHIRRGVDSLLHDSSINSEFENSSKIFAETFCIPIYPSLTTFQIKRIIDSTKSIINNFV